MYDFFVDLLYGNKSSSKTKHTNTIQPEHNHKHNLPVISVKLSIIHPV